MLMGDDFLLLFSKMPQVRTIHAWLHVFRLSLCIYNSQSSCIVVEEIAPLCVLFHDKLFSASMHDNFL